MDRRTQIVIAALSVFRQKGYSASRVEDICRAAGIAKGTFYLYFKTRDEVAEAAFEQTIERYRAQAAHLADRMPEAMDSRECIRLVTSEIRTLAAEAEEQLDLVPVLFAVLSERLVSEESNLPKRVGAAFDGLADAWAKVLEAGGIADARFLSRTAVSMLDGIILHAALFGGSGTDPGQAAERLCRLLESMVDGGNR